MDSLEPQTRRRAARPRRRSRWRTALAVVALTLVVLAAAALGAGWYLLYRPDHDIAAGTPVEVTIAKGSSTVLIAEELSEAGVVSNARMFRLEARRAQEEGALKAGTYALSTGMPYDLVIAKLVKGPDIVYYDVPIPEGFTARQIAARFADRAQIPEDELLALVTGGAPDFAGDHPYLKGAYRDSLEGYLFPATYRVRQGTSAEQVVEMMLDKFDAEIANVDLDYAASKNLTPAEVVTIASILEREAKLTEEYPLVASVIYNRLKMPMRLQLCATVLYEMPEGTDKVTIADTKRDTPYNTYVHDGLPPGPISNPGMKALSAAAHPPKTEYLYYVLTGADGSQTFTTNYDDFMKAKQGARD